MCLTFCHGVDRDSRRGAHESLYCMIGTGRAKCQAESSWLLTPSNQGATMPELAGKNVLITGALGTIGQALVAGYAAEGANVIALDRPDAANAQETLDAIASGIRYFGCDLNDLEELERRATELADEVGGVDV